jgi:hypothetical protein
MLEAAVRPTLWTDEVFGGADSMFRGGGDKPTLDMRCSAQADQI